MTEYKKQAIDFLKKSNATMKIEFIGAETNQNWNDNIKRNKYQFTITTPKGSMTGNFWDSLAHTESKVKPTEYDILSCIEKYDPGTMNDFFDEFGFEIQNADDIFRFLNTYNAVVKEYRDLCRIFTSEQMEELRAIY